MQQGVPEQRGASVDLEMQCMRRLEKITEKQVQKGGYTDESINHACLCSHPHSSIITHGMFKSLLSWPAEECLHHCPVGYRPYCVGLLDSDIITKYLYVEDFTLESPYSL